MSVYGVEAARTKIQQYSWRREATDIFLFFFRFDLVLW